MGRTSGPNVARRTAAAMTRDREDACSEMNKFTKAKLGKIEKLVTSTRETNLRYYYQLGVELLEIIDNPDTYTVAAIRQLERALPTYARTMRKARSFAREYTKDSLEALVKLKNPDTGFQLHWGHVSSLLSVAGEKAREDWALRAVNKMMDPPALHAAIRRKLHGDREGVGGRPHKIPATVHGQIRQIKEFTRNWVFKATKLWNGDETNIFVNIDNEPAESLMPEDAENLQELLDLLPQMRGIVTELTGLGSKAKKHIDKVLADREAAELAEEDNGKARRAIDIGKGSRKAAAAAS